MKFFAVLSVGKLVDSYKNGEYFREMNLLLFDRNLFQYFCQPMLLWPKYVTQSAQINRNHFALLQEETPIHLCLFNTTIDVS